MLRTQMTVLEYHHYKSAKAVATEASAVAATEAVVAAAVAATEAATKAVVASAAVYVCSRHK